MIRHNLISIEHMDEWTIKIDTIAAAALGGGHIAASLLRAGDMKLLRSFFDRQSSYLG